jgi:transposase
LNALSGIAPHGLKACVPQEWYERYGPRFESYRLPTTEGERESLAITSGQEGQRLLSWVYAPETPQAVKRHPAVEILRQVWVQQYYLQDDEIFWRKTNNMAPTERLIHSPYDPEARYSQKPQTEWFGYKAHITETGEEDQPRLITHVETTPATTQDEQVTETLHAALAAKDLLPQEHLLDRGYVDTRVLIATQEEHGVEEVGPVRMDTTWQAQAGEGFDVSCFTIDWTQHRVTCPKGQLSRVWAESQDKAGNPRI